MDVIRRRMYELPPVPAAFRDIYRDSIYHPKGRKLVRKEEMSRK